MRRARRSTLRGAAAAVLSASMLVAYSLDPRHTWLLWGGMAGFMLVASMWGLAEAAAAAAASARLGLRVLGHPRRGLVRVAITAEAATAFPPGLYSVDVATPDPMPVIESPQPLLSLASRLLEWRVGLYSPPGEWCMRVGAVVASDPLGFFERAVGGVAEEVCIEVAPEAVARGRVLAEAAGLVLGRPAGRVGAGTSFLYIREYEPGDDLRRVEWKASARSGRLAVKVMEREEHASIIVVLALSPRSLEAPPGLTPYEHAVEAVAALASALAASGSRVVLVACTAGEPLVVDARLPATVARALSTLKPPLSTGAWRGCLTRLSGVRVLQAHPRPPAGVVVVGDVEGVNEALDKLPRNTWTYPVAIAWRARERGVIDSSSSPIATALAALRGLARSMRPIAA